MIAIVIQARVNSTRLPGKIFKRVGGIPLLEHLLRRLLTTPYIIIVAVPKRDVELFTQFLESVKNTTPLSKERVFLFGASGEENDVLSRYAEVGVAYKLLTIIRVTGDNPLTSEECLEHALAYHLRDKNDLTYLEGWPHGTGVEIFSFAAIDEAHQKTISRFEREHVASYIYRHPELFAIKSYPVIPDYRRDLHLTVDTQEDFTQFEYYFKQVGFNDKGFMDLKAVLQYCS